MIIINAGQRGVVLSCNLIRLTWVDFALQFLDINLFVFPVRYGSCDDWWLLDVQWANYKCSIGHVIACNWLIQDLVITHPYDGQVYYRKTSSISRILVGNKIVDNSDVVGASPVGAAPTTSSFST